MPPLKRSIELIRHFRRRFALSPAEGRVAVFVISVLAGSIALRVWNAAHPAKPAIPRAFTPVDSVFTARAALREMPQDSAVADDESESVFTSDAPLERKILPAPHSVNINAASADVLERLPAVGPAMAERIIAFRANTPFRKPEELRRVSGIGRKKFARIAPYIKVE